METLREEPKAYVRVVQSSVLGTRSSEESAFGFWNMDTEAGEERLRFEFREFRGETPTRRLVGDGAFLWVYNLEQKTYAVTRYRVTKAQGNTQILDREATRIALFQALSVAGSGPSAPIVRLLREAHQDLSGVTYRTWMPGVQGEESGNGNNVSVVYKVGDPERRRMEFSIAGMEPRIESIRFWSERSFGPRIRTLTWELAQLDAETVPEDFNMEPFQGEDLRGWRPILLPRPVRES